jgi:arsenate reductase-like glutaredoxin family protein
MTIAFYGIPNCDTVKKARKWLNRRGTTFRKLEPEQKEGIDAEKAVRLMEAQPSMIKRPVGVYPGGILIGFDADRWAEVLG